MTLTAPAPAGGATVTLSSSAPGLATVNDSFTVPAGSTSAYFRTFTHAVSADTDVSIAATYLGQTHSGTLRLRAGNYYSFSGVDDYVGAGHSRRYAPEDSGFSAQVDPSLNEMSMTVSPRENSYPNQYGSWSLRLQAPAGTTLRTGTFPIARWPWQEPQEWGFDVFGFGRGCNVVTGTITIHDLAFAAGPAVQRFYASFVHYCEGNTSRPLYGEISVNR